MTVASSDNIAKRILMSPFRDDEKARMDRGRLTLLIFIGVLVIIILLQAYIRVPIQTVLILLAIVIMIIGKAKLQDLMAGLILHPIMAMTAGFLIAGALGLAGGFDVLITGLSRLAGVTIPGTSCRSYRTRYTASRTLGRTIRPRGRKTSASDSPGR